MMAGIVALIQSSTYQPASTKRRIETKRCFPGLKTLRLLTSQHPRKEGLKRNQVTYLNELLVDLPASIHEKKD